MLRLLRILRVDRPALLLRLFRLVLALRLLGRIVIFDELGCKFGLVELVDAALQRDTALRHTDDVVCRGEAQ